MESERENDHLVRDKQWGSQTTRDKNCKAPEKGKLPPRPVTTIGQET